MTRKGDSGSFGVVYYDVNQNRLKDLEPKPVTFSSTKFTTGDLQFTPPVGVAVVKVFAYKDAGRAILEIDHVSIAASSRPGFRRVQVLPRRRPVATP